MATLLLAAVDSTGVQAGITLAADHLVTVVLLGKLGEGGLVMPSRRRSTKSRVESF